MTCSEMDGLFASTKNGELLSAEAEEHVRSCPSCRELVSVMWRSDAPNELDPALVARVGSPVLSSLSRVRPLGPVSVYAAGLFTIFAALGAIGGKMLGIYGWPAMNAGARMLIFTTLVVLAGLAASVIARDMRPGAKTAGGWLLFAITFIAVETVFFFLFRDYGMGQFMHLGTGCLKAGLRYAIPAGVLAWLVLRRGYVVAPVSAGAAVGTLAGLAGLAALELHCPILTIPHVAVWHSAVVVLSIAAGAFAGWAAHSLRTRRR